MRQSGLSRTLGETMQHPFLRRYRAIVAICVGVVLLLPAILDRPNYEKHVSATQWQTDGAFVANGQPDPRDFPARVCGHRMHGSGEIIPRKQRYQADCDLPPSSCARTA